MLDSKRYSAAKAWQLLPFLPPARSMVGLVSKKPHRHQLEAGGDAGLDRKILRPRLVVQAEHVPGDDVGILDRASPADVGGQAGGAVGMVHEVAARIALIGVVGGHPQMVADEGHAPARGRIGADEHRPAVPRLQLVAGRPADVVGPVGIDELPVALAVRLRVRPHSVSSRVSWR